MKWAIGRHSAQKHHRQGLDIPCSSEAQHFKLSSLLKSFNGKKKKVTNENRFVPLLEPVTLEGLFHSYFFSNVLHFIPSGGNVLYSQSIPYTVLSYFLGHCFSDSLLHFIILPG